MAGTEPTTAPGDQSDAPFACELASYCRAALPSGPEWPVTVLPHGGGRRSLEKGIDDPLAVDLAGQAKAMHRRIHQRRWRRCLIA